METKKLDIKFPPPIGGVDYARQMGRTHLLWLYKNDPYNALRFKAARYTIAVVSPCALGISAGLMETIPNLFPIWLGMGCGALLLAGLLGIYIIGDPNLGRWGD